MCCFTESCVITSESWSSVTLCGVARDNWGDSFTTWPTPPGVGNFLLVGVLCWELVGLLFWLASVISGFLAGDGDWFSSVLTGMRDDTLLSRAAGFDSSVKPNNLYSKIAISWSKKQQHSFMLRLTCSYIKKHTANYIRRLINSVASAVICYNWTNIKSILSVKVVLHIKNRTITLTT